MTTPIDHTPPDEQYEYAGFGIRVLANIIDTTLFLVVFFMIAFAISLLTGRPMFNIEQGGYGLYDFSNILSIVITIVMWVKFGATPAKMLLNLKVLDEKTGAKLTWGQAIIRYIGYILAILVLGIGLIWVAFDPKRQGWHDKMAKTVVVKVL